MFSPMSLGEYVCRSWLRSQYLFFIFCVNRICYIDCLGLAVFVVPALGNGPVFILVTFVMLSTHGLSTG
jgi:hypothetical protein